MAIGNRAATENLQFLLDVNPDEGEAFFVLGVLGRTAPEEFRMAMLELRTLRLKITAEEQASGRAD